MPKTTNLANDLNNLIFNATALSWAANGSLYVSLHTANPGVAGNQTTSEATYDDYARVAVVRTSSGFTVATNTVTNPALIEFPANTGDDQTVSYFGIGTAETGTGRLLYFAELPTPVDIETSFIPKVQIGDLDLSES